jgi:hypothetical protein
MCKQKQQPPILMIFLLAMLYVANSNAATRIDNSKVTVFRCVDSNGKVSLQDVPCASSSKQETKLMQKPKDAPVSKVLSPRPNAVVNNTSHPIQIVAPAMPPPKLYRCTDFDGKVRDAEYYDPKPRCVPLWVLGYQTRSNSCRWVEDSCVRYEGKALCQRWQDKEKQAELDVRHSSSSDSAFLKSELARFTQIVQTSCHW